ncbi:HNH endonuclease [Bdellovibrio bacteriovorus]|uniref:HNH endonuclease n=1 Tax=Bdellovibrio bacteriovorus TaxID=959 RepID=UPI0035A8CDF5
MDFSKISNTELCERMEKLVRTERKITHLILLHIVEFESRRLYAEIGFDGMFSYLTKGLGYSESAAYRRLQSARVFKQVPFIADKIEDGSLNLSQLTQVQKCLKEEERKTGFLPTSETTENLISKIEGKTTFETEKVLAIEFDRPVQTHECLKPQKDNSVRLEVTLTKEQYELLEEVKNLSSHSCPDGSWAEVISFLAGRFKKEKMGKAIKPMTQSFTEAKVRNVNSPRKGRAYISIKTKRLLLNKAHYHCEYVDITTGITCTSNFQLQVDHIHPLALGGSNDTKNLRILCRTHNLSEAKRLELQRSGGLSSITKKVHLP